MEGQDIEGVMCSCRNLHDHAINLNEYLTDKDTCRLLAFLSCETYILVFFFLFLYSLFLIASMISLLILSFPQITNQ